MNNPHTLNPQSIIEALGSSDRGLSLEESAKRLRENGPNTLEEEKQESLLAIFLRQFKSPLIYVLLVAAFVATLLGELSDGLIICFVLVVNAVIGTFQEGKANASMRALKDFSKGRAVVIRGDTEEEIDDALVVVGDMIALRTGDKVPADARIISCQNLKTDESALTGESEPVNKNADVLPEDTAMPDRKNMIYKGTLVVAGEAVAAVVATGKNTFIGSISEKLKEIESEVPLKQKIRELSKMIGIAVLLAVVAVIMLGFLRGIPLREMFFTATAIAVSLIPEGLPVVITLILARGVYKMAKRNALVKNMQAVEALGQANIIAVDKTGTITKNELTVQKIFVAGKEFDIGGTGYTTKGEVYFGERIVDGANHPEVLILAKIAAIGSDASVKFMPDGEARVVGDPTEAALSVFGEKVGFKKPELLAEEPIVFEEPFSYERKFHTTMQKVPEGFLLSIVGEPESVLNKVGRMWQPDGDRLMTADDHSLLDRKIKEFSLDGLRIIAFAMHKSADALVDIEALPQLVFVGFCGMADVLREEVVEAVDAAKASGLRAVMITGDHLGTAEAIARKAHIFEDGDLVLSGKDLAETDRQTLIDKLSKVSVFGRVLPEHKLNIVEAYKARGDIIGMTGDGVNDALSLKAAHLGIAMGRGSTDVAKEAADLILLDNNFKSIVAAIEEGRSIYATIKKVVLYLVSTSLGEFLTIIGALLIGWPLPILPTQILWLNLVTDGFMVVALAFEPNAPLFGSRRSSGVILDKPRIYRAVLMGVVMMVGSLYVFGAAYDKGEALAWTLSLTVLAVFQWFNAWNCRSRNESAFKKPFSNPYLWLGLAGAFFFHMLALYNPFMQELLHTTPLSMSEWLSVIAVGFSIVVVEEVRKFFARRAEMR